MSVKWTERQSQVIGHRGGNLLVSAAAGSGKTAVLVERIIRMVTDEEHPVDIDRMLIMTFTRAAAAEMRERIREAIEKKLEEMPDNEHLQMQASLVHYAQITTIDSFCLNLIRSYFDRLDLDPSFRVGDEGELMLLGQDVMQELLEDYYEQGGEDFLNFVDGYATGKSDAQIEDYIRKVYTFAQSNPYPALWFAQCREELDKDTESAQWMRFICDDIRGQAGECSAQLKDAFRICESDEVLCAYASMLREDFTGLKELAESSTFEEMYVRLSSFRWPTLARVRSKEVDAAVKSYVTNSRDRAKKTVKKMQELYAYDTPEEMKRQMKETGAPIRMLLELAEQFTLRYQGKKRERNLVDFHDLEHEALRVLIREENGLPVMEDGRFCYTEAADELSRQFEEILIDEYQDSNLVQEALIRALSAERFGRPDIFMVGDVKQSIYRFRLARPELFLEKYESYTEQGTGAGRKIELDQNFRSRREVLDGVNDVFYRIMNPNLGSIRYMEKTALYPGAVFAPSEREAGTVSYDPELLLVDTGVKVLEELEEEAAEYTAKEIEARLIARKIRELTDPEKGLKIWDKNLGKGGEYRTAQYHDIVILLRSSLGWTETLLSVLLNENIPAYAESRTGYFHTIEVETVLSFLSVIDNPMQDIPLAAVLHSPIVGLTDEEMANMVSVYRNSADKGADRGTWAAMKFFMERRDEDVDQKILDKLKNFSELLTEMRKAVVYLPIHELIYRIYERTGYYHYVSAMPAGQTRRANLDMLVEKASDYEKTSYRGLFHFIRYMENLKKYDTDFGEASVLGEDEDTVRIMTIHKSKGLEFPIVLVAGLGKKFNRQDSYSRVLIDPELGISADYLNLEYRLKGSTLKKNAMRRKQEMDSLGEELRVLYVAMTRAKEKLIMTGTDRYLEKTMERYGPGRIPLSDGQIPYTILASAGSFLDWLIMSLGGGAKVLQVSQTRVEDLIDRELERQIGLQVSRRSLEEEAAAVDIGKESYQRLEKRLNCSYSYETEARLPAKLSVSELKQQGQMEDEAESVRTTECEGTAWQNDNGYGATRGTAYHRVLQLLPFEQMHSGEDVADCLTDLIEGRKITKEIYNLVDAGVIWRFLQSDIGRRMTAAAEKGSLHKEQQFVMGVPACEMGDYDTGELVVVQGIIDAWFEENEELVIVDYKTDRVRDPQVLIDHYHIQLEYYARALTQCMQMPVKEKIIYSLTMQREISL